MIKVFEMIQNHTYLFFLQEVQFVHSRNRTKVVGAINYKINIVFEHHNWVIYKMLFREELKPDLNS